MAGAVLDDRASHLVVRTPANPGYHWGNFALFGAPPAPGDAERWAAVFAREFPGAEYLALGVDGTDGAPGDSSARARLGVAAEVYAVLTATRLNPPARPNPAADIRPLATDNDWAQALALRIACEDSAPSDGYMAFMEKKTAEYRMLTEAGHGAWFGAFLGGRMRAGAGLFGHAGGPVRFQNVETHPGFRRRGLAASVVHRAGQWGLRERRARPLVIVADPEYHAIRVYRGLGFTEIERQVMLYRADGAGPGD
ncbi:GNAT family N-acetyltransferase [Streptomyces sp. NPDC088725]|uniref:GNAT family N-acetyltransferase n=1 Tax=Streptomyces sp. NPDC088725 TaxID=3365873 RepID=UPI00382C9A31